MMRILLAVVGKEVLDHVRDRRSLMTAALMSLVGPLMMYFMFGHIGRSQGPDQPLAVPVIHAERAPNLIRFLERHGATITTAPSDYEERVRDGSLEMVLVVPEDYRTEFEKSEPADVQLVHDSSRQKMIGALGRTEELLRQYGAQIQMMRLVARGVSPLLMQPLAVESIDLASAASRAARAMGMMAMFLLIAAFMGGLNAALDTTAGERERGSLEPLLLNPVPAWVLVVGKLIGALLATWLVVLATLAATAWSMDHLPLEAGLRLHLGLRQCAMLVGILLPITVMGTALQLLIGIFSRTFREAQTYVSVLGLLPMVPGMYLLLNPGVLPVWAKIVPFLGQTILIDDVLRGEALSPVGFTFGAVGAMAMAVVLLVGVVELLGRERVIFGR
jgi:sodium transport system permease protein